MSAPSQSPLTGLTPSQAAEHAKVRPDIAQMLLSDDRAQLPKLSITGEKESLSFALWADVSQWVDALDVESWDEYKDPPLDSIEQEFLRIRESIAGHRAEMIARAPAIHVENVNPPQKKRGLFGIFRRRKE